MRNAILMALMMGAVGSGQTGNGDVWNRSAEAIKKPAILYTVNVTGSDGKPCRMTFIQRPGLTGGELEMTDCKGVEVKGNCWSAVSCCASPDAGRRLCRTMK